MADAGIEGPRPAQSASGIVAVAADLPLPMIAAALGCANLQTKPKRPKRAFTEISKSLQRTREVLTPILPYASIATRTKSVPGQTSRSLRPGSLNVPSA